MIDLSCVNAIYFGVKLCGSFVGMTLCLAGMVAASTRYFLARNLRGIEMRNKPKD
jgi:hypothetical protein